MGWLHLFQKSRGGDAASLIWRQGQEAPIMGPMIPTKPNRRDLMFGLGLAGAGALGLGAAIPFSRWFSDNARAATGPAIRQDISRLDPRGPVLRAFVSGLRAMMALPQTHPLSWAFHANVHLTKDDPAALYPYWPEADQLIGGLWNNCPHGSYYFLPWHRLYLYFLERRLRFLSGDPDFALPYWNYTDPGPNNTEQRKIPAVFRDPSIDGGFNPLFIPDTAYAAPLPSNGRDPRYNRGAILDLSDVSVARAFSFKNFSIDRGTESFGGHPPPQSFLFGALEETPHNNIHANIGGANGLLGNLFVAARDPLFFAHHANVDRLWESWLALGQGRANPVDDPQWITKTWSFVDERLNVVTISPAEALDVVGQLGYTYDALHNPPPKSPAALAMRMEADIDSVDQLAPVFSSPALTFDHNGAVANFAQTGDRGRGSRWFLHIEGITTPTDPGASFGLWLGQPQTPLSSADPGFIGAVALLGMGGHQHHGGMGQERRFDVTEQMALLAPDQSPSLTIAQIRPTANDGTLHLPLAHAPIHFETVKLYRA